MSEGSDLLRRPKEGTASSLEPQLCPLGEGGGRGVPPVMHASEESPGVVQVQSLTAILITLKSSSHQNECLWSELWERHREDVQQLSASMARGWGSPGKSIGEQKLRLPVIVLPFLFHTSVSISFP